MLGSCSTSSPPADFTSEIAPIISKACLGCHVEGGVAPFSLETYSDIYAHRHTIGPQVMSGGMPPWHADSGVRDYIGDPSLSPEERLLLSEWSETAKLEAGLIEAPPLPVPEVTGIKEVDLKLNMSEAYLPAKTPDDYRCFVIDWPLEQTAYVTAFELTPGVQEIAHHAVAYLAYPSGASYAEAEDQADPGIGYECFGGPGRIGVQDYEYGSLGGWIPGYGSVSYPDGTGIKVEPGSKVVLQMHYNTIAADPAPDMSTISLSYVDEVEREGFYIAWLNGLWTLGRTMSIPAGQWRLHEFVSDPYLYFPLFENVPVDGRKAFHIYSTVAHMHERGVTTEVFINRKGQTEDDMLLRIADWDFQWQREYQFAAPVTFKPGDQLGIRCHFDNTAENQPLRDGNRPEPRNLAWGDGSDDEMCVALMYTTAD